VVGAAAQGFQRFRRGGRIAQRYGNIAQPALVADAADRVTCQALVEFRLAPGEQCAQAGAVQTVARRKFRVTQLCEAIPRTAGLAIVATVDAIADQRAEFLWNGPVQLDGQVGNAASRVDAIGGNDGARRARIDAGGAGAAVAIERLISYLT